MLGAGGRPDGRRKRDQGAWDPEGFAAASAIHSATPQWRGGSCSEGGGGAHCSPRAMQVQRPARSHRQAPSSVRHPRGQAGGVRRGPREQKSRRALTPGCCPLPSPRPWRRPGLLRPSQAPSPWRRLPSRSLTTWRAISVAAIAPASARAATGSAATRARAQETAELLRQRESVTLRARPSPVGGGAREGPPRGRSNPDLPSIAHPLGSGVWGGGGFHAPLPPAASPVRVFPATSAVGLCEGGRGLPSVTKSSAPPPLGSVVRPDLC